MLEANRLGCDVIGSDINPMAYWIVRQEIEYLNLPVYLETARKFTNRLKKKIGHLYQWFGHFSVWPKYFRIDKSLKDNNFQIGLFFLVSSAKSVGNLRLGSIPKCMIQSDFSCPVGPKAVCFSRGQFCFVVKALNDNDVFWNCGHTKKQLSCRIRRCVDESAKIIPFEEAI